MSKAVPNRFRVLLTADFYNADGKPMHADMGLDVFAGAKHIDVGPFDEHRSVIASEQIGDAQGVIVLAPGVTGETVSQAGRLLSVGRFGVGYDAVDVGACTEANVLVTITTGAVDRPVAEATVAWMLALTHHVLAKNRLVSTGQWSDRGRYIGCELRGRTLGVIGLGGIGQALISLLRGFGMNPPMAYDPFVDSSVLNECGARPASLDELLSTADFVSLHCPLNKHTRGMIGVRELGLMKPDGYLINTARGGIVDEKALYAALRDKRIAGAAIDCFEKEPATEPHPLGELENVILAPHSIAWTAELFRDIGRAACQSMLDLSLGKRPHGVLNPELFERASFREKWSRLTGVEVA
jgi:phosphoglycerate dehydrogenase-like enzyme